VYPSRPFSSPLASVAGWSPAAAVGSLGTAALVRAGQVGHFQPQPTTLTPYGGVKHSIEGMIEAVQGPRGAMAPQIRFLCEHICELVSPKDYLSEILAIRYWVWAHCPYFNDPSMIEWIRDPLALVEAIQASPVGVVRCDCDENAVLLAALWLHAGKEVDFITAGFVRGEPHTHVFVRCKVPGTRDSYVVCDGVAGTREPDMLGKIVSFKAYPLN